jgi:hypothetical protein
VTGSVAERASSQLDCFHDIEIEIHFHYERLHYERQGKRTSLRRADTIPAPGARFRGGRRHYG